MSGPLWVLAALLSIVVTGVALAGLHDVIHRFGARRGWWK